MKFLKRAGFVLGLALLGAACGAGDPSGFAALVGLIGGALLGLTLPSFIRDIIQNP